MTFNSYTWNNSKKTKRFLKNALLLLLSGPILLALCGCLKTVNSSGLTVVEYSPAIQTAAAKELRTCEAPTVIMMMGDYHVLRQQALVK